MSTELNPTSVFVKTVFYTVVGCFHGLSVNLHFSSDSVFVSSSSHRVSAKSGGGDAARLSSGFQRVPFPVWPPSSVPESLTSRWPVCRTPPPSSVTMPTPGRRPTTPTRPATPTRCVQASLWRHLMSLPPDPQVQMTHHCFEDGVDELQEHWCSTGLGRWLKLSFG